MTISLKTKSRSKGKNKVLVSLLAEGRLTPKNVLEVARNPKNPLHSYFEWNDTKAGERWRIFQATQLILAWKTTCQQRELTPLVFTTPPTLPASHERSVREALPTHENGLFISREDLQANQTARARYVDQRWEALRSWCNSVSDFSEFDAVRADIEKHLGDMLSDKAAE